MMNTEPASGTQIVAVRGHVALSGAEQALLTTSDDLTSAIDRELLTAPRGEVEVQLPSGAKLAFGPASRVRVADLVQDTEQAKIRLRSGSVRCSVPKLSPQQSFSVFTKDTQVVVHGTEFTVSVLSSDSGGYTRVEVHEGVVQVHGEHGVTRLTAGNTWTSADTGRASTPEQRDVMNVDELPKFGALRPASRTETRSGTLEQERALLQQGLSIERAGDPRRAATSYQRLLDEYPSSPLAPEAAAALRRVNGTVQR
jgi:hypothetical protein